MSSTPHPTPFLQAIALSGGPGSSPLIRGLTHTWCAGVHWVCGDEGSGKTTLLRLLAGDLPPMSGQVKRPDGGVFWLDLKGSEHDTLTVQACWNALQPRWPQWNEALLQELAQALDETKRLVKRFLKPLRPQIHEHADAIALINRLSAKSASVRGKLF